VLYSPGRGAEHVSTFIHEEPLWYDITDHRPVRTIFKLDTGAVNSTPVKEVVYPADLDMKDDDQLDQYYDKLTETWESYTPVDDEATAEEISQELLHISQVMYDTARAMTKKPRTKT
jgi:hypothetical protein